MNAQLSLKGASLRVNQISMAFGGLEVLSDVSFEVPANGVLGIVGSNGSGKTTLLNCISGVYHPHQGNIYLDEENITNLRPHRVASHGVARTFQHVEIPLDLDVIDLVLLGRHTHTNSNLISYGLGLPFLRRSEARNRQKAREALALLNLERYAYTKVGELPYGLAKRVDIARALAQEPRIVLLDEPAAGLNQEERSELAELVSQLTSGNLTVVLVEHDMSFVSKVCNKLVVMVEGHCVFEGATREALDNPTVVRSLLGEDLK
ncbi:MAG: ABC transporter ATP-binding protein [Actinobacteria bacterium]|jgi:branched-chain amino acid transport system ATP-binding protein|nr:ABC transporter ATP-binding protein [Actinomycetota bacterium]MCL6095616.1 ABC transporter ATP-binding protein [Actinomycetota bacterium]